MGEEGSRESVTVINNTQPQDILTAQETLSVHCSHLESTTHFSSHYIDPLIITCTTGTSMDFYAKH